MRIKPLRRLVKGISIDNYVLKITRITRGRFREEENTVLSIIHEGVQHVLLYMKIFYGRPPYYRAWIELFNINNRVEFNGEVVRFFNTELEDQVLDILAESLEGGEKLYIEYLDDPETYRELETGIPPVLSRLGYKLFQRGFLWFKDWYYPEGFMEGGPKLQAEKPISDEHRIKLLRNIYDEVKKFMEKERISNVIRDRAVKIMGYIENIL